MKERLSKGYLTVEATITVTTFLFFMLFIINMGQVYRAQNYVAHGMLQTGQMLSFASYEYGKDTTISKLNDILNRLPLFVNPEGNEHDLKRCWKNENYADAAEIAFSYCAGGSPEETSEWLKIYGIDGSIQFSETEKKGKDLYLRAEYKIKLPFALFNYTDITLHQQVVCRLWE